MTDEIMCECGHQASWHSVEGCQFTECGCTLSSYQILRAQLAQAQGEIERLKGEQHEWMEERKRILSETCPGDEQHCTCVPELRAEIERLMAENEQLKQALRPVGYHDVDEFYKDDES